MQDIVSAYLEVVKHNDEETGTSCNSRGVLVGGTSGFSAALTLLRFPLIGCQVFILMKRLSQSDISVQMSIYVPFHKLDFHSILLLLLEVAIQLHLGFVFVEAILVRPPHFCLEAAFDWLREEELLEVSLKQQEQSVDDADCDVERNQPDGSAFLVWHARRGEERLAEALGAAPAQTPVAVGGARVDGRASRRQAAVALRTVLEPR